MTDDLLMRKYNILKARISVIIEEHADALAQAQGLHRELEEAKVRISEFEKLRNENVQKKDPTVTIINEPVETTNNQNEIS